MKRIVLIAAISLIACNAALAQTECKAKADEKKLAGAARTSSIKKCCTDPKLHGAAAKAHTKKCMEENS